MVAQQVNQAGSPVIELMLLTTCLGDQIDISTQLVGLTVYEDMFSPVLTGEAIITDNIGLFDNLPISGNETLTIKFYSYGWSPTNNPMDFLHRTFDVVKIVNISEPTDYMKQYSLILASPELKKNEYTKISQSYQNMRTSQIVGQIMTGTSQPDPNGDTTGLDFPNNESSFVGPVTGNANDIGWLSNFVSGSIEAKYEHMSPNDAVELWVEKTKYVEPWVTIPYMKPFDAIKWLASRSIRDAQGRLAGVTSANFMFFENKRGFQFVSLSTLMESKAATNAVLYYGNALQNQPGMTNDQVDIVEDLKIENCYDILANINRGLYASRLYTYDMTTGAIVQTDYDFLENFWKDETVDRDETRVPTPGSSPSQVKDYPMMQLDDNNENPLTQRPLSKRLLIPLFPSGDADNITSTSSMRSAPNKLFPGPAEYLQNRLSQLGKIADFRVIAKIAGNTQHKVGDLIDLDISYWDFSQDPNVGTIKSKPSKYYNGNYLITHIKHMVNNFEYKMVIELVKDSVTAKIASKPA